MLLENYAWIYIRINGNESYMCFFFFLANVVMYKYIIITHWNNIDHIFVTHYWPRVVLTVESEIIAFLL